MASHGLVLVPRPDSSAPPPACTVNDVLEAWLAGRNPNTLKGYAFDLKDFARFLKIKAADAAVEMLLAAGPGQGNRIALAYRPHLVGHSSHPRRSPDGSRHPVVGQTRQAARSRRVALDVQGPRTKAYRDTRRTRPRGLAAGSGPGQLSSRTRAARASEIWQSSVSSTIWGSGGGKSSRWISTTSTSMRGSAGRFGSWARANSSRRRSRSTLRPATQLRAWIAARGRKGGPLFIRLDPAALPGDLDRLSGDAVERMVKRLSRGAGLSRKARPSRVAASGHHASPRPRGGRRAQGPPVLAACQPRHPAPLRRQSARRGGRHRGVARRRQVRRPESHRPERSPETQTS